MTAGALDRPCEAAADLTRRRETEVELFSLAGHDGYLREVNAAFAQILALTPQDLSGLSLLELVHPDDLAAVVAGLAAREAGGGEVLVENRVLPRTGAPVHLQWVARTLPGTDCWWAAGRDTTHFHQLLAERLALQTRLDLALGQTTAAMWELDGRTGALVWEPQAAQLLGRTVDDCPADAGELAAAAHPDDAAAVIGAVQRLLGVGHSEVALRVGDGPAQRHLSMRGKVLDRDRRGRPRLAVGLLLDVTAEKAMEEQMLRMVMSDALTGIPNRRAFDQALKTEWRRCTRAQEPLSVAMIDIDDFKRFNDTYGHLVGDEALCAVARSLTGTLHRPGDVVARFGGEEFALVLPGTPLPAAQSIALRLLDAVRQISVRQAPDWKLSVSIGAVTWQPGSPVPKAVDLLTEADRALYTAKSDGKDCAKVHAA